MNYEEKYLGVDIGGSHLSFSIVTFLNNTFHVIKTLIIAIKEENRNKSIFDFIMTKCRDLCQDYEILSIGLAVPGNVDPEEGIVRYLPNFDIDENEPIQLDRFIEIETEIDIDTNSFSKRQKSQNQKNRKNNKIRKIPITMRNDGRCHAIAETTFNNNVKNNGRIVAMLTLGTGIGGALIINNTLFDGSSYDAGDFGHSTIYSQFDEDAFQCNCGKKGCFETHASAQGLVRHYLREIKKKQIQIETENDTNTRKDNKGDKGMLQTGNINININAENILQYMRITTTEKKEQDPLYLQQQCAQKAWVNHQSDLARGIANLICFYNPDTIILGGGLSLAPELLTTGLLDKVDELLLPASRDRVKIIKATLGVENGYIGAALIAKCHYEKQLRNDNNNRHDRNDSDRDRTSHNKKRKT